MAYAFRRPWIFPLGALVVIFLAFSLPPYLSLDPSRSRVPQPDTLGVAHYWTLVPHVLFGSVALATAVLQIWPWFRQRHPAWHRRAGRVYVFGGVLPAGLTALVVGAFTPFGPVTRASNVLLALLWLGCTVTGWRRARQRRYADHRRWMIRSFALTASIISNRIWGAIAAVTLAPQLDTTFHGDPMLFAWIVSGFASWLGWTLPLLVSQWWLDRDRRPRGTAPAVPRRRTAASVPQPVAGDR
ncbi:DUF2306 domain-containing protein [Actinoplanes sp. NPDC049548]|uniref:DUF2306 domain-containing protein n=1 Tax=Actinoplanes sp. NPDC049548 TaxID=3155152 RepID=UPI003416071C